MVKSEFKVNIGHNEYDKEKVEKAVDDFFLKTGFIYSIINTMKADKTYNSSIDNTYGIKDFDASPLQFDRMSKDMGIDEFCKYKFKFTVYSRSIQVTYFTDYCSMLLNIGTKDLLNINLPKSYTVIGGKSNNED